MNMFSPEDIAKLRSALGLSVAEFAKQVGVHRASVYFWESGHCHPRYKEQLALGKLAEKLETQKVG